MPATPTPTPTATPTPTPTPTITPTPSPTPTPELRVTAVGFTGDFDVQRYPSGEHIDLPDGTQPTWTSSNNPKAPVAYLKGSNLNMFAKFSVTPSAATSSQILVRAKRDNVVTTAVNATLFGSEIRIDGITVPFSNLESGQYVKSAEYKFQWEVSFDQGNTWRLLSGRTEHTIHWLAGIPSVSPFKDANNNQYSGVFDLALKWSTGKVSKNEADIKKVIKTINSKLAAEVAYNPNSDSESNISPLSILASGSPQAVCWDNALLLYGLLRTIGISEVQDKFSWGGDNQSGKRSYYCPLGGCTSTAERPTGNRITMQTKRDALTFGCPNGECVERNPSFKYHATVEVGGTIYDPSYGIIQGPNEFGLLTAVKQNSNGQWNCVYGNEATQQLVIRNSFGNAALSANNDTMKVCSPSIVSAIAGGKGFRFDGLGGADTAIVRPSTSEWVVKDENDELTSVQHLDFDASQDVIVPGDYDGDGITDPAVWYGNGLFLYRMSSNYYKASPIFTRLREVGDIVIPGDYDGDGISDPAIWRPSNGVWLVRKSTTDTDLEIQWGLGALGDKPVPADYDGDGKTDLAVWRSSSGDWWVLRSSDWGYSAVQWGMFGDIPVQGDYDGDGKTDYAVVRPNNGVWYLLESENGYQFKAHQGPVLASDDIPVPADYNSDSETDVAVWIKSTGSWWILDSQTSEVRETLLGSPNDIPVMSFGVFK